VLDLAYPSRTRALLSVSRTANVRREQVVEDVTSTAATVGVRPAVSFRALSGGRLWARVVAARSFAGRLVQLQRRSSTGRWTTVMQVRLGTNSAALFTPRLKRGSSTLRVVITARQAGAGYRAGISSVLTYRRS
jgi:hypothetical protein